VRPLRPILMDLNRWCNAKLGGAPDQGMSQTVGLNMLHGDWWALPVSAILSVVNLERNHCIKSLFDEQWRPLWPDRMPRNS
jgi:hypothetical protein